MVNCSIQSATKAHQTAVKALIRTAGINPMGLKWQRFLVAVDEADNVIGCGQVKPHRDGSLELASIAVAREWRKQGIASALIEELITQHPHPLWLTCMSHLISFYAPFGFVEMTDRQQMPSYFRRAVRLFPIYARLASVNGYLAVMVNQAD